MAQLCSTRSAVSEAEAAVASTWVDAGAASAAVDGSVGRHRHGHGCHRRWARWSPTSTRRPPCVAVDDATADGVVSVAIGTTSLDGRRVIVGSATAAALAAGLSSPDPMPSTSGTSNVKHDGGTAHSGEQRIDARSRSRLRCRLDLPVVIPFVCDSGRRLCRLRRCVRPVRVVDRGSVGRLAADGSALFGRTTACSPLGLMLNGSSSRSTGVSCVAVRSAVRTNARTPTADARCSTSATRCCRRPLVARVACALGDLWPVGVVAPEVVVVRRHRLVTSFAEPVEVHRLRSGCDTRAPDRRPDVRPRVYLIRHETATSVSCKRHVCHSNDTDHVGDDEGRRRSSMTARRTTHRSGSDDSRTGGEGGI